MRLRASGSGFGLEMKRTNLEMGIMELNCVMEVKSRQTLLLWNMRVGEI